MRCPDCNKFAAMDTECESIDVSVDPGDGFVHLTGNCRIVRNCQDCGQTLKSCEFEIDHEAPCAVVTASTENLDVEEPDVEITESGGGRYAKNMIGFSFTVDVKQGDTVLCTINHSDEAAASSFDEEV